MKGILFSTPMVEAIQREIGPKTITRRTSGLETVNENPDDWEYSRYWNGHAKFTEKHNATHEVYCKSRYQTGDILYVRETYYAWGYWQKTDDGKLRFIDRTFENGRKYYYYADGPHPDEPNLNGNGWHKRPSLFMPKAASRIFLKVTDVRAERLQDITEEDAIAEGIEYDNIDYERLDNGELIADYKNYLWRDDETYEEYFFPSFADPINSFRTLWDSINAKTSPWEKNDWVWVYKFEKIQKP